VYECKISPQGNITSTLHSCNAFVHAFLEFSHSSLLTKLLD
jgi:hypothetical protein